MGKSKKGAAYTPIATTTTTTTNSNPVATEYGTTSLGSNSDDLLQVAAQQRRRLMRYGAVGLAVFAVVVVAVVGYRNATAPVATPAAVGYVDESRMAIAVAPAPPGSSVRIWQSSYLNNVTRMFEELPSKQWRHKTESKSYIRIDMRKQYQEIFGFGGAFTEAAALQFAKLPPHKQEEVLNLYFDKETGAGYEFGRVPMGSCDFSVKSYSYDDVVNDTKLEHFDMSVSHDQEHIIPFIQGALKKNPNMKFFLSPWSPPGWMKNADIQAKYVPAMTGSASPNGLKEEYFETWANYFSKFMTAYKQHGINFWGLTPQNEPMFAAPWEACTYEPQYLAKFLGQYLGPIVKRDHPDVKIMLFDHNLGALPYWARTVLSDPHAGKYIDGLAFHWYNYERFMDGVEFHEVLNSVHEMADSRFILSSESCNCPGVMHGSDAWFRGQRYAHDIIADLNNWVAGWVDWNLILDHTGGPNHLGNQCDAPIIIDETDKDYFIQPMYYFVKHFSKFIPSGSRRVHADIQTKFQHKGDAQLFPRYPVVLHSCDGSSRQHIRLGSEGKLHIEGTEYCVDIFHMYWEGDIVTALNCSYSEQRWRYEEGQLRMDFSWTFGDNTTRAADDCLQFNETAPPNDPRLVLGKCTGAESQQWEFSDESLKPVTSDRCLTAGYSFVQSAAFVTPEGKKVVVVLNENTEDAEFELQIDDVAIDAVVPRGGIQTFTWE